MAQNAGVYEIVNLVNGNRYVGSSVRISSRINSHKCLLRKNKSHNKHLQSAFNKYGEAAFVFRPILYCDPENTLLFEQRCLDGMQCDYNNAKNAEAAATGLKLSEEHKQSIGLRSLGNKYSLGRINPPETIARMSAARKGKPGSRVGFKLSEETKEKIRAANLGRKHTPEELAKMSTAMKLPRSDKFKAARSGEKNPYAKLTWSKVREIRRIFHNSEITQADLARKFCISPGVINKVVRNLAWKECE